MVLTKAKRGALVGALVVCGFVTWASAMVRWDDPPQTPKRREYVAATQVAGVLVLFGLLLTGLPVASGVGTQRRRDPEPDPGPSPVRVRWHRVTLTKMAPDDLTFRTPSQCPACGDHEVGWTVLIATRQRTGGLGLLLGASLGGIGTLAAQALTKHDDVSINACDPCFQLDASRSLSRVLLLGAWFSPSLIAVLSALFGQGPLGPTLAAVAVFGVAALLVHRFRFTGRRARVTALVSGLGVRGRLAKATWFSFSDSGLCWSLIVDVVDPTWAQALIARNSDTCDVTADEAALEAHATELRAAELR